MEFSEREIPELATFFAKRFPSYEQRAALSEAAGLAGHAQLTGDAVVVWTDVIRVAVQRGRLQDLVERALQQRPYDDNLREMSMVIVSGRRWRGGRWGAVAAGGAVCALGLLIWSPWSSGPGGHTPGVPVADAAVSVHQAAMTVETDLETEGAGTTLDEPGAATSAVDGASTAAPTLAVADETGAAGPEPTLASAIEPVATAPTPRARAVRKPASAPLRCEGPDGEVIGYWYAGESAPPTGSSYTVDGGSNVRADYPDVHNDFDARAALVCTLGHGWKLRIGHEPVAVPGGAYWVPLAPDDIVSR